MQKIGLYSISDAYIAFLRSDQRLKIVFDNKEDVRLHTRKYLGVVLLQGEFHYYIPFSSPKGSDYIIKQNGLREIRKNIIPIIRMTTNDTVTGQIELKGTLKLSNMIPVPQSELTPYNINEEKDVLYKSVVSKEYSFIKSNFSLILKNASILYKQKTNSQKLFAEGQAPKYIENTVDFLYAEKKCREYMYRRTETLQ